eukprot:UN22938
MISFIDYSKLHVKISILFIKWTDLMFLWQIWKRIQKFMLKIV